MGGLQDLVVQKRGDSKRVVALSIEGDAGEAVVRGLRIRRVLGLREMLFVIDKEYDETGELTHFTFNGRGWGHGVGLCQVGAGRLGKTLKYGEILAHYYPSSEIEQVYVTQTRDGGRVQSSNPR